MICVVDWLTRFSCAGEIPRGVRRLSCGVGLPAPPVLATSASIIWPLRCSVPRPLVLLRVVSVLFVLNVGIRKGHEFLKIGESMLARLKTHGAFKKPFSQG
jgi:hypothetical protein